MSSLQDLEQEVLRCWEITQDLDLIAEEFEDDEISNHILGLKHVYDLRFNKAWKTYELLVKEYYKMKNLNATKNSTFDEEFNDG